MSNNRVTGFPDDPDEDTDTDGDGVGDPCEVGGVLDGRSPCVVDQAGAPGQADGDGSGVHTDPDRDRVAGAGGKVLHQIFDVEDERDGPGGVIDVRSYRSAARALALAASTSRSRAGAFVTRLSSRCCVSCATCCTASSKAASLAKDGFVKPVTLRTYCRAEASISSAVAGGS